MDANVRRELDKLRALGGGGGGTPSDTNPVDLGTAAPGVGTDYSRFDHVHAHGAQLGGALHAAATNATAGFASAAQITALEHLEDLSDKLSVFPSNGVDDTADVVSRIADAVALGKRGIHFGGEASWVFDCGGLTDDSGKITVPSDFSVTSNRRAVLNVVNTSTLAGAGGVNLFRVLNGSENIRFEGLKFVGDNGTAEDGSDFTYVVNNDNACIDIMLTTTHDVLVTGCTFKQLWGFSVHDRGDNSRVHVTDCHFLNCSNGANVNANHSIQTGNTFVRSEGIEASGRYSVYGFNTFEDCFGVAISAGGNIGGTIYPGSAVIGNLVSGVEGTGIVINDGFAFGVVSGNVVRKCTLGGMVMYSSGATAVQNNIVSFNVFDSNCASPSLGVIIGCDIRGNTGGHNIFGNQFTDSGEAGFSQSYGMSLNVPDCIVGGNRFDGAGLHDASFGPAATNIYLGDNFFVNNTQEFLAGATIAVQKRWGLASGDRVWEHRVWNATMGALRSLHAVDLAGKYWWGDGTNVEDTNLYRSAADTLKTDDALVAAVSITGDSTTSAQNGQFHAKNSNTNAFAAFRAYNSGGTAEFSFGYANSGTGAPFTSGAYISTASGTVTRFLTASIVSAEISTGRVWDFTSNPLVGGVAILNQSNVVASITNKTFTSPVINSATVSGTIGGNATLSGNLTLSGTNTHSGSTTFSGLVTGSGVNSITAFAGGGQASATALTRNTSFVTTVASSGDSVRLPTAALSLSVVVYNLGANSLNIFPVSGSAIDALGANVAYSLAAGASRVFDGQTTTQWRSR